MLAHWAAYVFADTCFLPGVNALLAETVLARTAFERFDNHPLADAAYEVLIELLIVFLNVPSRVNFELYFITVDDTPLENQVDVIIS